MLGQLVLPGIQEIVNVTGIIKMAEWVAILKPDHHPGFRFRDRAVQINHEDTPKVIFRPIGLY